MRSFCLVLLTVLVIVEVTSKGVTAPSKTDVVDKGKNANNNKIIGVTPRRYAHFPGFLVNYRKQIRELSQNKQLSKKEKMEQLRKLREQMRKERQEWNKKVQVGKGKDGNNKKTKRHKAFVPFPGYSVNFRKQIKEIKQNKQLSKKEKTEQLRKIREQMMKERQEWMKKFQEEKQNRRVTPKKTKQ